MYPRNLSLSGSMGNPPSRSTIFSIKWVVSWFSLSGQRSLTGMKRVVMHIALAIRLALPFDLQCSSSALAALPPFISRFLENASANCV